MEPVIKLAIRDTIQETCTVSRDLERKRVNRRWAKEYAYVNGSDRHGKEYAPEGYVG